MTSLSFTAFVLLAVTSLPKAGSIASAWVVTDAVPAWNGVVPSGTTVADHFAKPHVALGPTRRDRA